MGVYVIPSRRSFSCSPRMTSKNNIDGEMLYHIAQSAWRTNLICTKTANFTFPPCTRHVTRNRFLVLHKGGNLRIPRLCCSSIFKDRARNVSVSYLGNYIIWLNYLFVWTSRDESSVSNFGPNFLTSYLTSHQLQNPYAYMQVRQTTSNDRNIL